MSNFANRCFTEPSRSLAVFRDVTKVTEMDKTAKSLVYVYYANNMMLDALYAVVMSEIATNAKEETVLRYIAQLQC